MQASGGASTAGTGKRPCYFFNFGGCSNSDANCKFGHVKVSADEKAKMVKPERRDKSRSPSPGGGPRAAGPGKTHCFKFLKGECTRGADCVWSHSPQEELDRQAKAKAKAKAKAEPNAKAEPKAKAHATPFRRHAGIVIPVRSE